MARDRPIRRLVAEQIGGRNGVDLTAIAHALEEDFGVTLPREQLARLSSYGELLQLLRDVLAGSTDGMSDEELASCVVRARVVAGGSDGRVAMVRVGWLTPELATAIADDVRNAPTGTWLDFLVPDDLTDGEVTNLRQWLRAMISQQVRVNVRRTSERAAS